MLQGDVAMENSMVVEDNLSTQGRSLRGRNFVQDVELQLCHSYVNIN